MTDQQKTPLAEAITAIADTIEYAARLYGDTWDSALCGNDDGNYHGIISEEFQDIVARAADDSRDSSWLCDYLEAVSPANVRLLLAAIKDKDRLLQIGTQNIQDSGHALTDLRRFIEMKWPGVADLPSAEAVLANGPEAKHETDALIAALNRVAEFYEGEDVGTLHDQLNEANKRIDFLIRRPESARVVQEIKDRATQVHRFESWWKTYAEGCAHPVDDVEYYAAKAAWEALTQRMDTAATIPTYKAVCAEHGESCRNVNCAQAAVEVKPALPTVTIPEPLVYRPASRRKVVYYDDVVSMLETAGIPFKKD